MFYPASKENNLSKWTSFFMLSYQFIFNFVGSLAGWVCFYVLLSRTQHNLPNFNNIGIVDFVLFVLSLLGLTGHLPQTTYGLVVSIGKFAEAGTQKLLGK